MVKVFVGTEQEYYMDGYLSKNLDIAKKVIKKDWDMIFCVDGYEGSGKSVLAQQVAYYCDPSLNLQRITFNPDQFKEEIMKSEKYQAVVYDEAYGGLSSRSALEKVNKSIVQMLTVIREKNLFIFIVLPTFFDLTKYVALWRSRALINVYTTGNFERGYFGFYNKDKKKELYVKGKKFYNYDGVYPNFRGRFLKKYVVDEGDYRKKKNKDSLVLTDDNNKRTESQIERDVKKEIVLNIIHNCPKRSITQISKELGVSRQSIYNYLGKRNQFTNKDVI